MRTSPSGTRPAKPRRQAANQMPARKKDRTASYLLLERSSPTFLLKRRILGHLLREHVTTPVPRVWDASCGSGTLSPMLAACAQEELLLTDVEAASVETALRRLEPRPGLHLRGQIMDLEKGPRPEGSFDVILCWAVLEHLADDSAGLRLLAATLSPGGRIILNVPLHPRLFNALDRLEDHYRRYSSASFKRLVSEAGLKIHLLRAFGFPGLLATKLLWAPFATRETEVAASRAAPVLARAVSAVDFAVYLSGFPWGPEAVAVVGWEEPANAARGAVSPRYNRRYSK